MMIKHINEYFRNDKPISTKRIGRPRKRGERSDGGRLKDRPETRDGPQGIFVYFISVGGHGAIKVGRSSNIKLRVRDFQIGNPEVVSLSGLIDVPSVAASKEVEAFLHRKLKAAGKHISGEWFRMDLSEVSQACLLCEQEFKGRVKTRFAANANEEDADEIAEYIAFATDRRLVRDQRK